jgi:hypothetical protein
MLRGGVCSSTTRVLASLVLLGASGAVGTGQANSAGQFVSDLEVLQVRSDVYMIANAGANIAVQIGQDGVVVVDTGTAERAEQVITEIRKLTP